MGFLVSLWKSRMEIAIIEKGIIERNENGRGIDIFVCTFSGQSISYLSVPLHFQWPVRQWKFSNDQTHVRDLPSRVLDLLPRDAHLFTNDVRIRLTADISINAISPQSLLRNLGLDSSLRYSFLKIFSQSGCLMREFLIFFVFKVVFQC